MECSSLSPHAFHCAFRDAISNAKFRSRSHRAVIRVYDAADNMIETHEHAGSSKSGDLLLNFLPDVGAHAVSAIVQPRIVNTPAKCVNFVIDLRLRSSIRFI